MLFNKKKKLVRFNITPKGFAYFPRRYIEDQVDSLNLFEGCERLRKNFDSDCMTDIVMAAQMKSLVPVVAFLSHKEAFEVFDGKALLSKFDIYRDDAGDDAEDNS